jgi:hypothetical protein
MQATFRLMCILLCCSIFAQQAPAQKKAVKGNDKPLIQIKQDHDPAHFYNWRDKETRPEGKLVWHNTGDGVEVRNKETDKPVGPKLKPRLFKDGYRDVRITVCRFSPNGKLLAIGTGDKSGRPLDEIVGLLTVWDVQTGKQVVPEYDTGYVYGLRWEDDEHLTVICVGESGK